MRRSKSKIGLSSNRQLNRVSLFAFARQRQRQRDFHPVTDGQLHNLPTNETFLEGNTIYL